MLRGADEPLATNLGQHDSIAHVCERYDAAVLANCCIVLRFSTVT